MFLVILCLSCLISFSFGNDYSGSGKVSGLLFSTVCQSGIREDNTNYIYCARRGLTEIPVFSKNNVVYDELVLSDNRIAELGSESFARIKVKKIFLNGNPVRKIEPNTFSRLENHLEELWLDADQAAFLPTPKTIMTHLRNLNSLRLKGFFNKRLENNQLQKLNRLEVLSLQFSSIEFIEPLAFEGLRNSLRELYLDGNLLQTIPVEALSFKNLKVLSLAQNSIKSIGKDAFSLVSLPNLNRIDISYNGLKQIDAEAFNSFNSSLEVLYLQNNELNSFNLKFIRSLDTLKELNLDFNIITKIPRGTFINSARLAFLSLQGNSILLEEGSGTFEGLSGVQRLSLARNGIKQLPDQIFQPLTSLKSLILDKNQITNLGRFTFDGLQTNLVNLSLHSTKIKSSHLTSLRILERLERIKLGSNDLHELDLSVFDTSRRFLTNLDVQNNQITTVYHQAHNVTFDNLLELALDNNKLCDLDAKLVKNMPKLKNLGLSQNPLYCDCGLLPLHEWLVARFDKETLDFNQWQCEMPTMSGFKKRRFISLKSIDFICDEESLTRCIRSSGLIGVPTTTTTTTTSTTTTTTTSKETAPMPRISNMGLSSEAGVAFVSWELDSVIYTDSDIDGFKVTFAESGRIDDSTAPGFLIDKTQRSFKIENLKPTRYTVCVSIIRHQGYDKYCREVDVESESSTAEAKKSTRKIKLTPNLVQSSQSVMIDSSHNNLISGLVLTLLLILASFTLFLVIFVYFYLRKCRRNEKMSKKIIKAKSGTIRTYTGAILSTNSPLEMSPQLSDASCNCETLKFNMKYEPKLNLKSEMINNSNHCTCVNIPAFTIGDTSTVSSTLSSVNTSGAQQSSKTMATSCCLKEHRYEGEDILGIVNNNNNNNNNAHLETFKRVRKFESNEPSATSPSSFTHFIVQQYNNSNSNSNNNSNPQTQVGYLPYELYNCFQNANLIVAPIQHLTSGKIAQNSINSNNPNDHVYCEIPSTIGRGNCRNSCQLVFNNNNNTINDNQLLMQSTGNALWKNASNAATLAHNHILHHHHHQHQQQQHLLPGFNQNSATSLLHSSANTTSSSWSSTASTSPPPPPQLTSSQPTSFNNNNKFNNASII